MTEEVPIDLSDRVLKIVREEVERYPDDAESAAAAAWRRVQQLDNWHSMTEYIWLRVLKQFIYTLRHRTNKQIRACTGFYHPTARIATADGVINKIHKAVYDYSIQGRAIGDLPISSLDELADAEEAQIRGKEFNAKLLRTLAASRKVQRADKKATIKDVYTQQQLWDYFLKLGGEGFAREQEVATV